jgi:hypothetical protein
MRKLDLFTRVELSPLKIKTNNLNFNVANLNTINKIPVPKGNNSGVEIRKGIRVGKLKKMNKMENQIELKWHQKPKLIIILLIFFFPVGLYFMWKNNLWTKKTRWIVTGICSLFLIGQLGGNGASYSDGIGSLTHDSSKDWDKNHTLDEIGKKVYDFVQAHPDAKKLIITIKDQCTDNKGNKNEFTSEIIFTEEDLNDFETYKDKTSFTKNSGKYVGKMIDGWKRCGGSF